MKSEYIQPFIKATLRTFEELVDLKCSPSSPSVFDIHRDLNDVSAIIGLAGEVTGAVVLSFKTDCCLAVSSAFTGIQSTSVDEIVKDAIGELVNVIAGNAKEDLLQFKIYISLPNVVFGEHGLHFPQNSPAITVPFNSMEQSFNLIVALKEIST